MHGSPPERPPTSGWDGNGGTVGGMVRETVGAMARQTVAAMVPQTDRSSSTGATPITRRPRFLTLNTLPRLPSSWPESSGRMAGSPLMKLPTEIRLRIYALLVLPRHPGNLRVDYERVASSTQDCFNYARQLEGTCEPEEGGRTTNPTLHIRTIDPLRYKDRYGCTHTTYHCVNVPRIEGNLGILRANKQIHAEASELLYTSYTFDFDTHVEAIAPFLSDLTPFARGCIKSMRIVKRASPYVSNFDRWEWTDAWRYMTSPHSNVNLRHLDLGVVAGRPEQNGWERVARYSAQDVALLCGRKGMEWMQYLLELQGLQELDVRAIVEYCPPTTSSTAMAEYVRFSASVEGGFSEFLKSRLLAPVAAAGGGGGRGGR